MKGILAGLGSAFVVLASLTLLPIVISVLGGFVLTTLGAAFTFWRYTRRREA
ncbi:MAG: hypothetical protein AMXMBFR23_22120 [Chloroflexota bacterium]